MAKLYVKLDSHGWVRGDYTDENSLGISGTIYSDAALSTAFNITGYTLVFRITSQGRVIFSSSDDGRVAAITPSSGTFRYKPELGDLLTECNGEVSILLEKTGTEITAIGINGSSNLHIQVA